jgi:hypothetical protein
MLNYTKLMSHNPTSLGKMMNDKGQQIEFFEHPTRGDEYPVIAVLHETQQAGNTEFYELDDMTAEHGEYQPWFDEQGLHIG